MTSAFLALQLWLGKAAREINYVILATPPSQALACVGALRWPVGRAMICVAIDVTRDLAALATGAMTAPIYPQSEPGQAAFILNNVGAKLVIVENAPESADPVIRV